MPLLAGGVLMLFYISGPKRFLPMGMASRSGKFKIPWPLGVASSKFLNASLPLS